MRYTLAGWKTDPVLKLSYYWQYGMIRLNHNIKITYTLILQYIITNVSNVIFLHKCNVVRILFGSFTKFLSVVFMLLLGKWYKRYMLYSKLTFYMYFLSVSVHKRFHITTSNFKAINTTECNCYAGHFIFCGKNTPLKWNNIHLWIKRSGNAKISSQPVKHHNDFKIWATKCLTFKKNTLKTNI